MARFEPLYSAFGRECSGHCATKIASTIGGTYICIKILKGS